MKKNLEAAYVVFEATIPDNALVAGGAGGATPSAERVEKVSAFFRAAGFEVGAVRGLAMMITGPDAAYLRLFGHRPSNSAALPLDGLPPDVAENIEAVATDTPPDYGVSGGY